MQTKDALLALIHLVILLLCLSLGIFSIGLIYAPEVRYQVAKALLYDDQILLLAGSGSILLTLFLTMGFYMVHRKRSLYVQMDQHPYEVDSNIIKATISTYWKEAFPGKVEILSVLILPNRKIEILAQKKELSREEEFSFLATSENKIGQILADLLDYDQEFFLTLRG